MSDGNVRDLERQARAGDEESERQLLQERLRSGDLTSKQISLVATLGHEAAALVSGHDCQESMSPCIRCWDGFQPLDRACELGGTPTALRMSIAGARYCFSALEQVARSENWEAISAFAWSEFHERPTGTLPPGSWRGPAGMLLPGSWEDGSWRELSSWIIEVIQLAEAHALGLQAPRGSPAEARLRAYSEVDQPLNVWWPLLPLALINEPEVTPNWFVLPAEDKAALVLSIASELTPWALGHSDPIRMRVEARQREAAGE